MNKKILILIFILFNHPLQSIIILIHGTFAAKESWYRPGGDFYDAIEEQATLINQKVIPFMWSGANSYNARLKAAECLAKIILSYPKTETFTLISHSHGGNVINLTSQLLYDPLEDLMQNYTQEELYNEISAILNINSQDETKTNITTTQIEQIIAFITAYKNLRKNKSLSLRRFWGHKKKYLIDRVYFLGTPINENIYNPNMDIIQNLYNLYSSKDFIQTVFGYYSKKLKEHERIINLQVNLQNKKPSHSELHNPTIARWLLKLPETHQQGLNTVTFGQESFSFEQV